MIKEQQVIIYSTFDIVALLQGLNVPCQGRDVTSLTTSGGTSILLSYLSKSKDTLIENNSSKSESHPVKYYLSKNLKVFGCIY